MNFSLSTYIAGGGSSKPVVVYAPLSGPSRKWGLLKPSYGIYEYDRGFGKRKLRWGDGSWQELTDEDHVDLILLTQFGSKDIDSPFD
ncbi:hypothetical protein GOA99_18660 [Sinorhizobium meliloti]|nr:hypothetical protein [Sinorhizobium meliloti]